MKSTKTAVLNKVVRGGITDKVTFVQTPIWTKGEDHLNTWAKKNILCRRTTVQRS